jgi:hypothetical protein
MRCDAGLPKLKATTSGGGVRLGGFQSFGLRKRSADDSCAAPKILTARGPVHGPDRMKGPGDGCPPGPFLIFQVDAASCASDALRRPDIRSRKRGLRWPENAPTRRSHGCPRSRGFSSKSWPTRLYSRFEARLSCTLIAKSGKKGAIWNVFQISPYFYFQIRQIRLGGAGARKGEWREEGWRTEIESWSSSNLFVRGS